MRNSILIAGASAALILVAGCDHDADDRAADQIEEMAENRAEALEDQADIADTEAEEQRLEDKADRVREYGEDRAEAADEQDDVRIADEFANEM